MFAFATSLFFHIVVIFVLLSGSVFFRHESPEKIQAIRVGVVSPSALVPPQENRQPKPRNTPEREQEKTPTNTNVEKDREALTKLAHYNPPAVPEKIDNTRPETLLSPPKRKQKATKKEPSLPVTPKKNVASPEPVPSPPKKREVETKKGQQQKEIKSETTQRQPKAAAPKRRPKEQKTLASVLKSLQKRDNSAKPAQKNQSAQTAKPPQKNPETNKNTAQTSAQNKKNTITAQDLALLNQQLSNCWTIISTDRSLLQNVRIRLFFNEKFHVRKLEFVDKDKYDHDPTYRVAAEQAKSAILHPACQPLALPKEKISPDIVLLLNFDPKALIGTS